MKSIIIGTSCYENLKEGNLVSITRMEVMLGDFMVLHIKNSPLA